MQVNYSHCKILFKIRFLAIFVIIFLIFLLAKFITNRWLLYSIVSFFVFNYLCIVYKKKMILFPLVGFSQTKICNRCYWYYLERTEESSNRKEVSVRDTFSHMLTSQLLKKKTNFPNILFSLHILSFSVYFYRILFPPYYFIVTFLTLFG